MNKISYSHLNNFLPPHNLPRRLKKKKQSQTWEPTKLESETSTIHINPSRDFERASYPKAFRSELERRRIVANLFNFWVAKTSGSGMADHQRIHPVAIESPLPLQGTIPAAHAKPAKKRRSCCCCCCKCLCCTTLTIVILIILIGATAGILYLIFDPKIPKYSVDRLSISAFDVDNSMTVRASFDVTVTATNPNKKIGIYYEEGSYLSVWYSDSSLCNGTFPEFYQGHRNTTVLNIIMTGETQLGSELLTELQQQQQTGTIPLLFKGDVPVRVKFGRLKLWKVTFRVRCSLVVNSLSASNQISIKSSSCKFKLKL